MNNIYEFNILNDFFKSINPDQHINLNDLDKYYFYNNYITYEFHVLFNNVCIVRYFEKNFNTNSIFDKNFQNMDIFFKYIVNIKFFKNRIRKLKCNKLLN